MPLTFKVTTAGRAALVNATNTGTLPVLVSQVGVTATAFTAAADGSDLALPGELKRLVTFGGAAVAADTIHAVIRDDSADVYSLRGIALYLDDGTLFGLYGQADVILEKSAAAMMLLATDVIFANIDAASLTFGDTGFLNPPATVDTSGVVELATDAETITGTDGTRAVTPKGLLAKLTALLGAGAPSAFVKTLLTALDVVAFRTLLSIKTAASYDIGVGNGLDADLLDGQHGAYYRAWGNLTGVPATFTPSAHAHSADDITSGTLTVARGGTGAGTFTAGSYLVGAGTGPFGVKTPGQVLGDIGAAPVVHSHAIDAVNGLLEALNSKADLAGASFTGAVSSTASMAAATNFLSSTVNWVGATAGPGGAAYLRPAGVGSVTGQLFVSTGGISWDGKSLWHTGNFDPTSKQNALGFTPVQQGTGAGQLTNTVKIGWSVGGLKAQVDSTDLGTIAFTASPVFSGVPLSPTPAANTNTSQIATTAFVQAVVNNLINGSPGALDTLRELATAMGNDPNFAATVTNALALKAPLASPALTGTPTAPTAVAGTSTTQLATTAFVQAAIAAALANYLPKNNPTFTGTMTGPAYNET